MILKIHAAACLNAAEYDRRKGVKTMPPDTEPVWTWYKRRRPTNDKKKPRLEVEKDRK